MEFNFHITILLGDTKEFILIEAWPLFFIKGVNSNRLNFI